MQRPFVRPRTQHRRVPHFAAQCLLTRCRDAVPGDFHGDTTRDACSTDQTRIIISVPHRIHLRALNGRAINSLQRRIHWNSFAAEMARLERAVQIQSSLGAVRPRATELLSAISSERSIGAAVRGVSGGAHQQNFWNLDFAQSPNIPSLSSFAWYV